jgi:hypothetical protein
VATRAPSSSFACPCQREHPLTTTAAGCTDWLRGCGVYDDVRFNTAETFSTIRFGACAKSIKNKPKVNMTRSLREVTESLDQANKTIARQSKLIAGLQATVEQYRAILKQHGIPDNVTLPDLSTVTVKPAALAAGVKDAMMATPQRSDSPSTSSPLQSTPVTNSRIPTRSTSRPSSSTSGKSQGVIVGVRSRPSTSSGAK